MNYWKLMLAVAAGILIAGAITVGVIGVLDYLRAQRLREAYLRSQGATIDGNNPFARAKKAAGSDPDKISVAAAAYCTETAWNGASPERQKELWGQCVKETSRHLAEEMK